MWRWDRTANDGLRCVAWESECCFLPSWRWRNWGLSLLSQHPTLSSRWLQVQMSAGLFQHTELELVLDQCWGADFGVTSIQIVEDLEQERWPLGVWRKVDQSRVSWGWERLHLEYWIGGLDNQGTRDQKTTNSFRKAGHDSGEITGWTGRGKTLLLKWASTQRSQENVTEPGESACCQRHEDCAWP